MRRTFIIALFLLSIFLVSCSSKVNNKINLMNKSWFLTATVYNATMRSMENNDLIEDAKMYKENSHEFKYEKIKIIKGYTFKVILDFELEPYFTKNYIGEEIQVVVSLFALYSPKYQAWYEQKMIIFKTEQELVGFLSPTSGQINLETYEFNVADLEFSSAHFLTDEAVVKYYERGDRLYNFFVNLSDPNTIIFQVESCLAFISDSESLPTSVIENSLVEISEGEILDLMELAKIKKIEVWATIYDFDYDNGILYVESEELPTLETVNFLQQIYDLDGKLISVVDLEIGDVINVCYYQRYSNYKPVNIFSIITVNKIVEVEENNN